jgi:hypothetical protein
MSKSPIIVLPENETRRAQLRAKLKEYRGRMSPYQPPEMAMDTVFKAEVLATLLEKGRVDTHALSREVAERFGDGFNLDTFGNACAVIDNYCTAGGENIVGGTGLPQI